MFRSVDNHFHDPEAFVANTESLADNAGVRERLFDGFRTEVIAIADGVDLSAPDPENEPEDADDAPFDSDIVTGDDEAGDAPDTTVPVTDERIERDQAIEAILLDVFDSDAYDRMFDEQLGDIQAQVVRAAELPDEALLRDPGQVSLNARPLFQPIYTALAADPRTASITENEVPPSYGIYEIADRETTINATWWLIENGPSWRGLTYALAILSFIGAVVVAERRPTRVIQFGAGIVGLALVVIVIVYIVRALVPLLATGSGGDGAVSAVYVANLAPLVSTMIRLLVLGVVLGVVGGVARLIWPDDWVYGHVADDRGVRSIRRRRNAPEAQAAPQQPVAAATPVAYPGYPPGYPPQPYGYPQAPYPGQPYPVAYQQPYPSGPYAQPVPPGYATGPRGTVPVIPVGNESVRTGENPTVRSEAASAPPADAAGVVPRVVAAAEPARATVVDADAGAESPSDDEPTAAHSSTADGPDASPSVKRGDGDDVWDDDGDW